MAEPKTKNLESLDSNAEDSAEDSFATDRKARAAKYLSQGAGVNQGDQRKESADALEKKAKREAARMSLAGKTRAADLRDQANRMRGDE